MAEPKAECQIVGGLLLAFFLLLAWLFACGQPELETK